MLDNIILKEVVTFMESVCVLMELNSLLLGELSFDAKKDNNESETLPSFKWGVGVKNIMLYLRLFINCLVLQQNHGLSHTSF